jgi:hypothetical protein
VPERSRVRLTAALLCLAAVTACGGETREASGIDGVVLSGTDPSHEHTTEAQDYPDQPPVGGPHWPPQAGGVIGWLRCGVYTEPVPDEFAVHSLEHGAVWLTYLPGATDEQVGALTELAAVRPDYSIVSPYPGQDAPFTATAWGAQLAVDDPSDRRLRDFVDQYAAGAQGGEQGADCANGTTPEAARAALAAADGR